MSRYVLLFLLNLPFALAAILSAITRYKLRRTTGAKTLFQLLLWLFVILGLALAEPIYRWLFKNNLTETEPLSLFDVIQITGIVASLYIVNRTYTKVERLEERFNALHQELSITLSENHERKISKR